MDRGAWQSTAHEVAESWTQLKQLRTHAHFKSVYSAFLDSDSIVHLIAYSIVYRYCILYSLYVVKTQLLYLETRKVHVAYFIAIFSLLQWSEIEPALSLRSACIGANKFS